MLGAQLPAFALDLLVVGLSTGLVGSSILDRLRGEDEHDENDEDPLLDDGGLGGDDLDDEFGDLADDDEDWGDDPFDGMDDDADEDTAELENRLGELENEVATLSSTVGTVRGENEQISETVENVEEDVRQLLDIYEMVTRGINPFVDDAGGLGGDGLEGSSFGLFEDDEEDDDENLDPDVADADAQGFFDEELLEPSDEDPFADGDADDSAADEEDAATEPTTEDDDMATDDTTTGKSFDELKAEYESGEADWAEDDSTEPPAADGDADTGPDDAFEDDVAEEGVFETTTETFESEPGREESDDRFGDELGTDPADDEPGTETADGHPHGRATTGNGLGSGNSGGFNFLADDDVVDGPQRPYLEALPGGYVTDLLVMEWLEFLVSEATVTDAARAVNYYHRIGWIAEPVAADLREFLTGYGDIDLNRVNDPGCDQLTPEHHQQSLKYVMQLSGATAESLVVDRWDSLSGVGRGL